jgi:hypothetical protein
VPVSIQEWSEIVGGGQARRAQERKKEEKQDKKGLTFGIMSAALDPSHMWPLLNPIETDPAAADVLS